MSWEDDTRRSLKNQPPYCSVCFWRMNYDSEKEAENGDPLLIFKCDCFREKVAQLKRDSKEITWSENKVGALSEVDTK